MATQRQILRQPTVADNLGRKSSQWVSFTGASFTEAKADYDRLRPLGLTPMLRDCFKDTYE